MTDKVNVLFITQKIFMQYIKKLAPCIYIFILFSFKKHYDYDTKPRAWMCSDIVKFIKDLAKMLVHNNSIFHFIVL